MEVDSDLEKARKVKKRKDAGEIKQRMKVEKEEGKDKTEVASNRCDTYYVFVVDAVVDW